MPDFVRNKIRVKDGSDIDFGLMVNDEGDVDFNKIIPMPECLKDFSPHLGMVNRAKCLLGLIPNRYECDPFLVDELSTPISKEFALMAVRAVNNYLECGYLYWREWAIEKWGTKWNALNSQFCPEYVEFDTAWCPPFPVLTALSMMTPDVTYVLEYLFSVHDPCLMVKEFKNGKMHD